MVSQLLQDVTAAAQKRIHDDIFRDANDSRSEIMEIGAAIAKKYGGFTSTPDIKSEESALRKVTSDYSGDWHSVKDLARMTIIVPTSQNVSDAANDVRKEFSASNGRGFIQRKDILPDGAGGDPCGYSSTTTFVRTSNGRPAEIQINLPSIIYAKQSADSVKRAIGNMNYLKIKMKYLLEGGVGHVFYEIFRKNDPGWKAAAQISKEYYAYFRNFAPDVALRRKLETDIAILRKNYPQYFLHH